MNGERPRPDRKKYLCGQGIFPGDLQQTLDELIEQGEYIEDVQLTEKGSWLVHYGINCFRWSNIPRLLEKVLNEYEMDLDGLEALFCPASSYRRSPSTMTETGS